MKFLHWLQEAEQSGVWYHGSPNKFETFQTGKHHADVQLGFGIHFAQNREFAELYGSYIYECQLSPLKTLDQTTIHSVDDQEVYQFAQELYKRTRFQLYVSGGQFALSLDVTSPKRAERLLKQYGYDSVLYEAKYGSIAGTGGGMYVDQKTIAMTMLDPSKITILNVTTIH
jgi:hypothetical protein